MGAQTWNDVKEDAIAFCVGGLVVAAAMIAGICIVWPAEVLAVLGL